VCEQREARETEQAQGAVEMRSAYGHDWPLRAGLLLSSLTARAPIGGAIVVALAAGADLSAAARARTAGMPVDNALAAAAVQRGTHQPCGFAEHAPELLVGHLVEPQPRRELRAPERLRLPDVPDPGDEALVEQRVAELAALVLAPQVRDHRGQVGRVGEDVGAQASGAAPGQLEHRPVPEHRLALGAGEHEPRLAVPHSATLDDLPAPAHAQVAAQNEAALEVEQQVLADGLDSLEPAPVEPLRRDGCGRTRVRRFDGHTLADERLQAARRAVKSIAFGHTSKSRFRAL